MSGSFESVVADMNSPQQANSAAATEPEPDAMKAAFVVVPLQNFRFAPHVGQRQEPVGVHAFLAPPSVEEFDTCIVGRLAKSAEIQFGTAVVGSLPNFLCTETTCGPAREPCSASSHCCTKGNSGWMPDPPSFSYVASGDVPVIWQKSSCMSRNNRVPPDNTKQSDRPTTSIRRLLSGEE